MSQRSKYKKYSGSFKQDVVEDMRDSNMSQGETSRKYGVCRSRIQSWERIYLEEGPQELYIDRRGKKSTGRPPQFKPKSEEDLLSEVQRLRAEVDYLKKLGALVSKESQQSKKHK